MAISVICPGCDADYSVPENLAGKSIRCKKCGESVAVKAARPKVRAAVEDDDAPRRPASRRRDDDDDDDRDMAPRKKSGGMSPVLIGGVAALLLGGGVAAAYFGGAFGGEKKPDTSGGQAQVDPAPTPKPEEKKPAEDKKTEPLKTDTKPTDKGKTTEPEKKPEEKKPEEKKPVEDKKPAEAPPKTAPVASAPPRESQSPGGTMSYGDYINCNMSPLTQDMVKRSTVLFKVEGGEGSGWFALEPGLVITNAHVLDMLGRNPKEPKKIEIVINSGQNDERVIPHAKIKILAVDGKIDLGLLQIIGEPNLPPPLPVRRAGELQLSQKLRTFGFPLGSSTSPEAGNRGKNPEMSIRPTTVTALRHDDHGVLQTVQIEGGVTNGNSGGPIVDAEGKVCCVVVRGYINRGRNEIEQTQASAIATEWVIGLAAGRIDEIQYGEPIKAGERVRIPVKVKMLDPLKRVSKVGVRYWIGSVANKDKTRAPGSVPADKETGDSDHKEVVLKYDPVTKYATGFLDCDKVTVEKSGYWAAPFVCNALNPIHYEPGLIIPVDPYLVEEVDALLAAKANVGSVRTLKLANSGSMQVMRQGDSERGGGARRIDEVTMKETVGGPDTQDTNSVARLRLQFEKFALRIMVGEREQDVGAAMQDSINQVIKQIEALGWMNKAGEVYKTKTNVLKLAGNINAQGMQTLQQISEGVLESLRFASIPLPNESVKPGHTWTATKDLTLVYGFERTDGVAPGGRGGNTPAAPPRPEDIKPLIAKAQMNFTYKYIGIREREGRKEAVIEVIGNVVPEKGKRSDSAKGSVKGRAIVELETGTLIDSLQDLEFEIDISNRGVKQVVAGTELYKLSRTSAVR